ncbi:MAG: response regulator transcription factor [Sedimentisphaerales bacterium]|nr:response regulator transcription factor [Sedimentisphaerales bacterium]
MVATTHTELLSAQEWSQLKEHLGLPPRQAEIANSIIHGKSDKQIARELGISLPTVRTHMTRLFRKLDLNDRVELVLHVFTCMREHPEICG